MKWLVIVLALIGPLAGCSPQRIFHPEPSPRARFLAGFSDGYRSADPNQPYTREEKAYVAPDSFQSGNQAYQQGWKAGYETGRQDVEQRK